MNFTLDLATQVATLALVVVTIRTAWHFGDMAATYAREKL